MNTPDVAPTIELDLEALRKVAEKANATVIRRKDGRGTPAPRVFYECAEGVLALLDTLRSQAEEIARLKGPIYDERDRGEILRVLKITEARLATMKAALEEIRALDGLPGSKAFVDIATQALLTLTPSKTENARG